MDFLGCSTEIAGLFSVRSTVYKKEKFKMGLLQRGYTSRFSNALLHFKETKLASKVSRKNLTTIAQYRTRKSFFLFITGNILTLQKQNHKKNYKY
jgi:hypothetical protein